MQCKCNFTTFKCCRHCKLLAPFFAFSSQHLIRCLKTNIEDPNGTQRECMKINSSICFSIVLICFISKCIRNSVKKNFRSCSLIESKTCVQIDFGLHYKMFSDMIAKLAELFCHDLQINSLQKFCKT